MASVLIQFRTDRTVKGRWLRLVSRSAFQPLLHQGGKDYQ
nr:Hypothetical protein [Pseudomonas aeruginosa]